MYDVPPMCHYIILSLHLGAIWLVCCMQCEQLLICTRQTDMYRCQYNLRVQVLSYDNLQTCFPRISYFHISQNTELGQTAHHKWHAGA